MKARSSARLAAVVIALMLSGCGIVKDIVGRDPAPTPTTSAAEVLADAADKLSSGPFSFQFRTPDTIGVGAVDGRNGWLRLRLVGEDVGAAHLTFEVLTVNGQHLVRSDPLTRDQWTRLDIRKVDASRRPSLERFGDPAHAVELFTGIASAERVGEKGFRGTIDLTKVADPAASRLIDEDHLAKLDDEELANVPFEATVSSQGQLLGFRFTVPAGGGEPEQRAEISYSEHGYKPDLRGPFEGEIGTAPASVYEIING